MTIPAARQAVKWIVACIMVGVVQPLGAASPSEAELSRFTFTEYHMGGETRLVLYATDAETARTAGEAAFVRIAELEAIMSDYRPDSELMRLCDQAGGAPIRVSRDLFRVLERAEEVSRQTAGAFDITVGPLVQLWRTARRAGHLPTPDEIARARQQTGWQKVRLDRRTRSVRLDTVGMRLDLGGIAKGYACDEAVATLKRHGVRRALVQMGGDIVLGDPPPQSDGWRIEVPNAGGPLSLHNCAISTSGDTEQYVEIDGVRYSHIVDPTTGAGMTTRIQASVVAPSGLLTDPLATALTVMEPERHAQVLANYPSIRSYVRYLRH
jgi:FAD:protein FMN transferase